MDTALGKLNDLAGKLGGHDTRVATPSGLDGPGMSTSVYDIGLFYRYAWQSPIFSDIVSTRSFDFPAAVTPAIRSRTTTNCSSTTRCPRRQDRIHRRRGPDIRRRGASGTAAAWWVLMRGTRQPIAPWEQAAHLLDYGFATPPGTKVGTLIEPDPSLVAPKPEAADGAAALNAAPLLSDVDAMPVRVGVGIVGSIVVFGAHHGCPVGRTAARSTDRRH